MSARGVLSTNVVVTAAGMEKFTNVEKHVPKLGKDAKYLPYPWHSLLVWFHGANKYA